MDILTGFITLPDYEGRYMINPDGRIFSNKYNRILKSGDRVGGYVHVGLTKNGRSKTIRVHRLIAETFIPNPENKPQVNHIDCNKQNNRVSNLEWCTRQENIDHAVDNGLMIGPKCKIGKNTKLKGFQVIEIRKKYKSFKYSQPMLAREYGVSQMTICKIVNRKIWKHI